MKQLVLDLSWLESDWQPRKVDHHFYKELSAQDFDIMQAKSYGYDSVEHLNKYNYNKDMECKITYGLHCKRNK